MRHLFSLIFLISCLNCPGQSICEGHQLAFQAEQLYRSGHDLDKAVDLYHRAFAVGVKDGRKVVEALTCSIRTLDTVSTIEFLEFGLSIGFDCADFERLWFRIGKDWGLKYFLTEIDTSFIINQYNSSINKSLVEAVHLFSIRDQQYRSEAVVDWELQLANDSVNSIELKQLTETLGYLPRYSELGFDGSEDLEILFYHMNINEIQWFLPYIIKNIRDYESNLGHEILYQLDRIGMHYGVIYSISDNYEIFESAPRNKMNNGEWCQSFGEWFSQKHYEEDKIYFTPIDPELSHEEVNRVRRLLCLDSIEFKWKRQPWIEVVTIGEYEEKFK